MEATAEFKWCSFLGLLPTFKKTGCLRCKRVSYVIFAILAVSHIYCTYGKLTTNLDRFKSTVVYVNIIACVNYYTIFRNSIWKKSKIGLLLGNLAKLSSNIRQQNSAGSYFVFANLYFAALIICELIYWYVTHNKPEKYFYFTNENVNFYLIIQVTSFEIRLIGLLKRIVKMVNSNWCILEERQIVKLIKMHCLIYETVFLFNDLFGYHILFMTVQSVVSLLFWINTTLTSDNLTWETLVITVPWMLLFLGQFTAMTWSSQKLLNEARKSVNAVTNLKVKYGDCRKYSENLFILSYQASTRFIEINANGFFSVELSLVFLFVDKLATYVVFLVQLYMSQTNSVT